MSTPKSPSRAIRALVAAGCAAVAIAAIPDPADVLADVLADVIEGDAAQLFGTRTAWAQPASRAQPADDDDDDDNMSEGGDEGENEGEGAGEGEGGQADAEGLDIDALRQEYLELRDRLFRSRARAAAVASQLYSTKLRIDLAYASARFYTITRATVRLDGATVYDDRDGAIGANNAPRYEGFVAPGRHKIAIRIEAVGKDDERFESTVEHAFTIQAPAGFDVLVSARASDGGDIAFAWKNKQRGSYKLHLDAKVTTSKRAAAPAAPAAAQSGKPAAGARKLGARRPAGATAPRPAKTVSSR